MGQYVTSKYERLSTNLRGDNIAMASNTDRLSMCRKLKSRRNGHHKLLIIPCRKYRHLTFGIYFTTTLYTTLALTCHNFGV